MRWLLLVVLACACLPPPDGDGQRVYEATLDAWHASPLPPVEYNRAECEHLDLFEMYAPDTVEAYERVCPAKSWACLSSQPLRGARNRVAPVAVMHPDLSAARWAAHGVHELAHLFLVCAGLDRDDGHTRPEVWKGPFNAPNTQSVEFRAIQELYHE